MSHSERGPQPAPEPERAGQPENLQPPQLPEDEVGEWRERLETSPPDRCVPNDGTPPWSLGAELTLTTSPEAASDEGGSPVALPLQRELRQDAGEDERAKELPPELVRAREAIRDRLVSYARAYQRMHHRKAMPEVDASELRTLNDATKILGPWIIGLAEGLAILEGRDNETPSGPLKQLLAKVLTVCPPEEPSSR